MKSKKLLMCIIAFVLLLCATFALSACGDSGSSSSIQGGDPNCEHVWADWANETEATCETTGLKSRTCTLCGGKEEKVIEKTSHKYNTENKCEYCGVELVYTSGLTYEHLHSYSSEYYVTGIGSATDSDIVIPAYHAGEKVVGIGEQAFYGNDKITGVIASAIDEIGEKAFYYCEKLETVQFNNVTEIGYSAFANCKKLNTIVLREGKIEISQDVFADTGYFNNDKNWEDDTLYIGKHLISVKEDFDETEFDIKAGTSSVASYAFYNVSSIETINFPDNEIFISPYAFYGCSNWKEFEVTDDIWLTDGSISGTSLTKLVVPARYAVGSVVKNVNKWSDRYKIIGMPSSLKTLVVEGDYYVYNSSYNSNYDYEVDFSKFKQLESLEHSLSGDLDFQGAYANLKNLKTLKIRGRNNHIGECFSSTSFTGSVSVAAYIDGENKTYYFPASLKEITIDGGFIGDNMFKCCDNFQSITIKNLSSGKDGYNIGEVNSAPFYNVKCENLSIDNSAFNIPSIYVYKNKEYFNGVKNFYYLGTMQEWFSIKHSSLYVDNIYIDGQKMEGEVTISDGITEIPNNCFRGFGNVSKFVIPDSVTNIGNNAFYKTAFYNNEENWENGVLYCGKHLIKSKTENCVNVVIKEGTLVIADNAFEGCSSLTSITIPNSVTSIVSSAFRGCSSLTSITIPDSVTSIGDDAFSSCSSLTSVTIPNGVTSIGKDAFSSCYSLTEINYNATECTDLSAGVFGYYTGKDEAGIKVTIGKNVKKIPKFLFSNASYIKEVVFEEGSVCESIGYSAFYNCGLTSITIPNSVTSIGGDAFYYCGKLTSVTIGNSVTSIGVAAFLYCHSFTSVYFTGTIDQWVQKDFGTNPLYYAKNLYIDNKLVTEANITTATKINAYAFEGCSSLTSVTIGNSVTTIGENAFEDCDSLTSVTIGNSVTSIGERAFEGCSSLTSITIPNSVTTIGERAFYNCKSLTSITIPNSVTSIESSAFEGCSSLTSITIPNSVTSIESSAFYGCSSLTSITIPNSVTSIGSSAFYNCKSLTSITIPNSVTSIGSWTFGGCSSLTSVTIPNSVTSIGVCAFNYCHNLTSITIPDSVTSIGYGAFYYCSSLTSVYYTGTAEQWANISIGWYNSDLTGVTRYYYSEGEPTTSGNYWHYAEDGITPVVWGKES